MTQKLTTQNWLISCDESGFHGAEYYGYGSLWMKWERRGDFRKEFRFLTTQYKYQGECKWNKANNPRAQNFYRALTDYFFKRHWLAFHCIVIKVSDVNMKFHKNKDEARRKHFTMFLENKIKRVSEKFSNRENTYRVWVDPIHSRYDKAHEVVEKILGHELIKIVHNNNSIKYVEEKSSRETPQIQLCDFLLGAVMDAWQERANSIYKHQTQRHITS